MKSTVEVAPSRQRDTYEYVAMLTRMVRAAGPKVADTEQLEALAGVAVFLDQAIQCAVDQLRSQGFTWDSIGKAFGVTRQRAIQRWANDENRGRRD